MNKIAARFYKTPAIPLKAGRDQIDERHRTFALKKFLSLFYLNSSSVQDFGELPSV